MEWLSALNRSLDEIEAHLEGELDLEKLCRSLGLMEDGSKADAPSEKK